MSRDVEFHEEVPAGTVFKFNDSPSVVDFHQRQKPLVFPKPGDVERNVHCPTVVIESRGRRTSTVDCDERSGGYGGPITSSSVASRTAGEHNVVENIAKWKVFISNRRSPSVEDVTALFRGRRSLTSETASRSRSPCETVDRVDKSASLRNRTTRMDVGLPQPRRILRDDSERVCTHTSRYDRRYKPTVPFDSSING